MVLIDQLTSQLKQSATGRWFYGREPNEQRILLGIGMVALLGILWAFVWKPVGRLANLGAKPSS